MANQLKRRVRILDHGTFTLFGMRTPIPGMVELTGEQIDYIKKTGLYKIEESSGELAAQALSGEFSSIEGEDISHIKTRSVNELAFKSPLMATVFAKKAENAIIVREPIRKNRKLASNVDKNGILRPRDSQEKTEAKKETKDTTVQAPKLNIVNDDKKGGK